MKYIYLSVILYSLIGLTSCETTERIDDFPLRPSRLVVNSFFTPDSIWEFQVSKSLSVLDNADIKLISGAIIEIYSENILLETITEQDNDKWYRSLNNLPENGKEYSIEVTAPGFGSRLEATDKVPDIVNITEVKVVIDTLFSAGDFYSGEYAKVNLEISFNDPGNSNNYYQVAVVSYDTVFYNWNDSSDYYINRYIEYISSGDPSIGNDEAYNANLLFNDLLFDGKLYTIEVMLESWNHRPGKIYSVEFTSLSKAGYLYKMTISDFQKSVHDPFAEPVQIYCNIENGLGIFAGFSKDVFTVHPEY